MPSNAGVVPTIGDDLRAPHARSVSTTADNVSAIFTTAFGATVAMWAIGYVCRMPPAIVPSWLVVALMLAALAGGGYVTGQRTRLGLAGGALSGLLAALLNVLILGSVIADLRSSAAVWIPATLAFGAVWGAAFAWLGSRRTRKPFDWTAAFARVAIGATFLLLIAGGLVTSFEAGLAVPDWPRSFGYNMFFYPLSKMSGGIYYEHAHRLFGSLVGLTTIALAFVIWLNDTRRSIKLFSVFAIVLVIVQGVMGGLRVTGNLTMSANPADLAPNLTLALTHGVTGQLFFALIVCLAIAVSVRWKSGDEAQLVDSAGADRFLAFGLIAILFVQLVLGALVRHKSIGVMAHIGMAVFVALFAIHYGVRLWGIYERQPVLQKLGIALALLTGVQLVLGFTAFSFTQLAHSTGAWYEIVSATAHQANGAAMLGVSVAIAMWCHRLIAPAEQSTGA